MNDRLKVSTVVISDVHLGSEHSKVDELTRFLKSVDCDKLILNGDIIDGWKLQKNPFGRWKKSYTDLIKVIMKMMENHRTQVIYVRGNHDDFLDKLVPLILPNISIVSDYVHVSKGKRYYVTHGDIFDTITSHMIWLAKLGDYGYSFLLWLNKILNNYRRRHGKPYYSFSQRIKHKVKSAVSYISDFEKEINSSDWILFTSRNGVRAFFYNMKFNDTDIRCLAKIRFGVVGKATEQELKNHQIKADLVPDEQTGAGLAKALKKQISDQTKVCIFSAKEASEDLERELQKFCHVIKTDAYENVNVSEQDYILKPADTVISEAVFTSASNVERFFQMLTEEIMVERAYSIGKKTTEALKKKNVMNICESEESTYESVVSLITKK